VPRSILIPHPANYKIHTPEQLVELKASLIRFGQVKPVVVQHNAGGRTHTILAGHGITQAMEELQTEHPGKFDHFDEVDIVIVPTSWTASDAEAYLVADNETSNKAQNDEQKLLAILERQKNAGAPLESMGFSEAELQERLERLANDYIEANGAFEGEQGQEEPEQEAGSLLPLLDITIAEPRHQVSPGDVWSAGRHVLICVHVFRDWRLWKTFLKDDALFLPFPGPMVPLSQKANKYPFVMVQPDTYICGHILDRYADIHGEANVRKLDHVVCSLSEEEEGEANYYDEEAEDNDGE
jgi:hypothetical protein